MTHDAQEAEKDKRLAQQGEALPEGGRASLFLFLADGSTAQPENGNHRNDHIDREQHPPAHAQRRNGLRSSPHGDVWSQKRSNGFYKLSEGERTCQPLAAYDIGKQRVERRLHQRIADAQQ